MSQGDDTIYDRVIESAQSYLLPSISELYGLEGYATTPIRPHDGGRNLVYRCERAGASAKVLRISFLRDRTRDDVLAEVEYVRYLSEHGASVSNVVSSRQGNLMEEIVVGGRPFHVCLFEEAKGCLLAERSYRYREGSPLTEYYANCGKTLGRLHELSRGYTPVHRRYSFLDRFNPRFIDELIPGSLPLLKQRLAGLLSTLEGMERTRESFGLVHFDFNDGNYAIDYGTGQITVFDFDNACYCWYLYDLADLWKGGMGWIQFEPDAGKRKGLMEDYWSAVLAAYQSETEIDDATLEMLPLFIQVVLLESIVDAFEVMRNRGEAPRCDEELSYLIQCMEDDVPHWGFFHEIYSCEQPFIYRVRQI